MKYIEICEGSDYKLKISDDKTYQDVTIYCESEELMQKLVLQLTVEMLKEEE
jgi:hypothetical protein